MRSLVIAENITVDGAIEMLEDWFDPQGAGEAAIPICWQKRAGRGHQIPDLKLLDAKTFRNGVIYPSYAPV